MASLLYEDACVMHGMKNNKLIRTGKEARYNEETTWCLYHGQRNVAQMSVLFQG
jgi:hypothetical protein